MPAEALIARHVLRDAVRSRVLHGALLLGVGVVAASPVAGRLTAGQDIKLVKDLGLAAIELTGLFVAMFMGIRLLAGEIERRTVDTVLSKPIRRHQFVLGQFGGLAATLALALTVMAVGMYIVLAAASWWVEDGGLASSSPAPAVDPALLKAVFLLFVKLTVVAAAALCFSTVASPAITAASTCGLYVIGHFSAELRNVDGVVDSLLAAALAAGLSYALPDLASFDVKAAVVHAQPVTVGHMALTAGSGAAYVLAFLVLAVAGFARRDLT